MYSKYRKLLFIFSLIIVAGCDLGCIGSNELGDEGEIDKFYVRTNSNECSYSMGIVATSGVHSETIRDCLSNTTPLNAGVSETLLSTLNLKEGDYKCNEYDNSGGIESVSKNVKNAIGNDKMNDTNVITNLRNVFDVCLEYCQVKCFSDNGFSSSTVRSTNGGWVKNELYSNDSYYGITIDENSVININVSDKIFLSGDNNEEMKFSDYYHKNGDKSKFISVGSNGKLGLVYPDSNKDDSYFINISNYVNIINTLRRNYIEVNEYDSSSTDKKYGSISGGYYKDSDSESFEINVNSISGSSDLYNKIFEDSSKNFYYYCQAPIIFDRLKFGKVNSNSSNNSETNQECKFYGINNNDNSIEGFAISRTDSKMAYELTYNSYTVGYIWAVPEGTESDTDNDGNFVFNIEIQGPTKLAFKLVDNNDTDNGCNLYGVENLKNLTCKYTVSYNEKTEKNAKTVSFELAYNTKNNWYVLSNENQKEIVLGETYDYSSLIGGKEVKISTDNISCARGLIISELPLMEYKVKKSGYAFFYIPEYNLTDNKINYNIVNSGAFALDDDIGANYYELKSDSSTEPGFGQYYFDSINPLPKTKLESLDKDGADDEKDYGFYVRKGQIIRFDYKSWLTLNSKTNAELKTWQYQDDDNNTTVNVPFGFNLLLLTKERPAYLCSGEKTETVDEVSFCGIMGGSIEQYKTPKMNGDKYEVNNNNNVVYKIDSLCMADISGISDCNFNEIYKSIYKLNNPTIEDEKIIPGDIIYGPLDVYSNVKSLMPTVDQNNSSQYCISFDKNQQCYNSNADTVAEIINSYIEQLGKCYGEVTAKKNKNYYKTKNLGDIKDLKNAPRLIESTNENPVDNNLIANSIKESIDSITKYLGGGSYEVSIPEYNESGNVVDGKNTTTTINIEPTAAVYLEVPESINNVLQCYTLENYKGSMYYFINKTKNNTESDSTKSSTESSTNQGLDTNLEKLGVKNLKSFSEANNGGLVDAFTSRRKYENISSSYNERMLFETSFTANKSVYLSTYVLGDTIPLKLSGYSEGKAERILILNAKNSITAGDRLEIFMASNTINSSDLFNGDTDAITDDNENILWLVKYGDSGLNTEKSLYKFDKGGNLIESSNGGIGINLSNGNVKGVTDFIKKQQEKSVHDLVLYFKIKDVDKISTNNSGQYFVKITNYAANKNYVAEAFKILINEVMSLMDGRSFGLEKNLNGGYVSCQGSGTCYTYSESDVKNTGVVCEKDETNCFNSCDNISSEDDFSTKCEYIYNNGGFLKLIYKYIIADTTYQFLIKLSLIAMLVFYGFGYFLGLNNFTQEELVKRMIRIVFVYTLISPFGWEIYNKYIVSFFKQGIDSLLYLISSGFEVGNSSVIDTYLMRGDFTDRNILFSSGYDNLRLIFSRPIFNKMLGLVFSGWFGPIYFYLVLSAVISYCVGFISAIIMYISIQVFMSVILAIGPLIFFFLFFEKTKGTFDKWLDMLISFALQQIFIVLTLSFFNSLIFMVIKHVFSYTVCWSSILPMNIFGSTLSLISFWKVPTGSTSASALDLQTAASNGPGLYNIMLFYIIGTLMGKFVTNMSDLANSLAGGVGITGFSNKITSKISDAGNQLKGYAKKGLKAPLDHANRKLNDWNKGVNDEYDKRKNNRTRHGDNRQMVTSDNAGKDSNEGKNEENKNREESTAKLADGAKPDEKQSAEKQPLDNNSSSDEKSSDASTSSAQQDDTAKSDRESKDDKSSSDNDSKSSEDKPEVVLDV